MDLLSYETVNEEDIKKTRGETEKNFHERLKRLRKYPKRCGYQAVHIGTPIPLVYITKGPQTTEGIRQNLHLSK